MKFTWVVLGQTKCKWSTYDFTSIEKQAYLPMSDNGIHHKLYKANNVQMGNYVDIIEFLSRGDNYWDLG